MSPSFRPSSITLQARWNFAHFLRRPLLWTCFLLGLTVVFTGCKSLQNGDTSLQISGDNLTSRDPAIGTIVDLSSFQTICTATLYTTSRAVTAAHCLSGKDMSQLGFAVDIEGQRRVVAIGGAAVHPGFTLGQENSTSDIGFFELKEPLPVTPIPLAIDGKGLFPGAQTLVVGYGNNSEKYDPQRGEVRTGSGVKRAALFTISRVDPIQIIYGEVGPFTLHGDSGGPHLRTAADGTSLIVGITSYGSNPLAGLKRYSVANRVDAFAHFLGSQPGKPEPIRVQVASCGNYPERGGRCVEGEVHYCAEALGGFFLFRVQCDYPQTCGVEPQTAVAQCLLGKESRTVTITLYDQVLNQASLVKGLPLAGYYVFVDHPRDRSIVLNADILRTDAAGRVRITTSAGVHSIKIANPKLTSDYVSLPEFQVNLDAASPERIDVSLVTSPVEIRVQAPLLNPGWSVYLTGDTDLLGNYRTAFKSTYDSATQRWVWRGFLPRGLTVRALITPSIAGKVDLTYGTMVLWDKNGSFQIGDRQVSWHSAF